MFVRGTCLDYFSKTRSFVIGQLVLKGDFLIGQNTPDDGAVFQEDLKAQNVVCQMTMDGCRWWYPQSLRYVGFGII